MMATSLHPFRLIPDRFLRRNDVTAMANSVNDNRKQTDRRCRRPETEAAGRIPEVVPLRRLFRVDVPEINSELRPSDSLTLVLRKSTSGDVVVDGGGGFGFTLCGRCPAVVGRVDPGTPAARAGLAAGDLVERINGRNVSRSSADSVATIVRCSGDVIIVDVNRPKSASITPANNTTTGNVTWTTCSSARGSLDQTVAHRIEFDEKSSMTSSHRSAIVDVSGDCPSGRVACSRLRRHVMRRSRHHVDGSPSASASVDDGRSSRQRDSGYEGCRSSQLYEIDAATMTKKNELKRDGRPEIDMDVESTVSIEAVYQEVAERTDDVIASETIIEGALLGECVSEKCSKKSERSRTFDQCLVDDEGRGSSDEENRPPSSIGGNVLDVAFVIASGSSSCDHRRHRRRRHSEGRSWRKCNRLSKTFLWDPSISVILPVGDNDVRYQDNVPCSVPSSGQRLVTSPRVAHSAIESALHEFRKCAPSTASLARHRKQCPTSAEIVQQIALCERRFADDVSDGVSRLSRPLRYHGNDVENDVIISRDQHELLFQNIEKLLVTSEYSAHRLCDVSNDDDILQDVASLYSSQLCSAYRQYCSRLPAAKRVLAELTSSRLFDEFLQVASLSVRSVEDFITRPLQHIHNIRYWLSRLLYVSPTTSSSRDAASRLSEVLTCLDKICDPENSTNASVR